MLRGSGSASLRLLLVSNRSSNPQVITAQVISVSREARESPLRSSVVGASGLSRRAPPPPPLRGLSPLSPILTPTNSHVHHTTAPAQSRSSARALHSRIAEELCAREKPSSHPGALALSHECADFQSRDTPNARMPCPIYLNTRIADQSPDSALPLFEYANRGSISRLGIFFIFDLFGHDSHLAQGLFKTC